MTSADRSKGWRKCFPLLSAIFVATASYSQTIATSPLEAAVATPTTSKANLEEVRANLLNAATAQEALRRIDEYRAAVAAAREQKETHPTPHASAVPRPVPADAPSELRQRIGERNIFTASLENLKHTSFPPGKEERATALLDLVESHREWGRVLSSAGRLHSQPNVDQEAMPPRVVAGHAEVSRLRQGLSDLDPQAQREVVDAYRHALAERREQEVEASLSDLKREPSAPEIKRSSAAPASRNPTAQSQP